MPPEERPSFVQDSCGGDVDLLDLVVSLIRADEDSGSAWDCAGVDVAPPAPMLPC